MKRNSKYNIKVKCSYEPLPEPEQTERLRKIARMLLTPAVEIEKSKRKAKRGGIS